MYNSCWESSKLTQSSKEHQREDDKNDEMRQEHVKLKNDILLKINLISKHKNLISLWIIESMIIYRNINNFLKKFKFFTLKNATFLNQCISDYHHLFVFY